MEERKGKSRDVGRDEIAGGLWGTGEVFYFDLHGTNFTRILLNKIRTHLVYGAKLIHSKPHEIHFVTDSSRHQLNQTSIAMTYYVHNTVIQSHVGFAALLGESTL